MRGIWNYFFPDNHDPALLKEQIETLLELVVDPTTNEDIREGVWETLFSMPVDTEKHCEPAIKEIIKGELKKGDEKNYALLFVCKAILDKKNNGVEMKETNAVVHRMLMDIARAGASIDQNEDISAQILFEATQEGGDMKSIKKRIAALRTHILEKIQIDFNSENIMTFKGDVTTYAALVMSVYNHESFPKNKKHDDRVWSHLKLAEVIIKEIIRAQCIKQAKETFNTELKLTPNDITNAYDKAYDELNKSLAALAAVVRSATVNPYATNLQKTNFYEIPQKNLYALYTPEGIAGLAKGIVERDIMTPEQRKKMDEEKSNTPSSEMTDEIFEELLHEWDQEGFKKQPGDNVRETLDPKKAEDHKKEAELLKKVAAEEAAQTAAADLLNKVIPAALQRNETEKQAAIKIQKVVRGKLARKAIEIEKNQQDLYQVVTSTPNSATSETQINTDGNNTSTTTGSEEDMKNKFARGVNPRIFQANAQAEKVTVVAQGRQCEEVVEQQTPDEVNVTEDRETNLGSEKKASVPEKLRAKGREFRKNEAAAAAEKERTEQITRDNAALALERERRMQAEKRRAAQAERERQREEEARRREEAAARAAAMQQQTATEQVTSSEHEAAPASPQEPATAQVAQPDELKTLKEIAAKIPTIESITEKARLLNDAATEYNKINFKPSDAKTEELGKIANVFNLVHQYIHSRAH